jgi:site-specific DNA recombinase
MDEGGQILARNAQRLFKRQAPREKRRVLNFLVSNCSWENGEVRATFRQPLDLLADTTAMLARHEAGDGQIPPKERVGWGTRIRT